jgi:hypothetical protein
MDGSSPRGRRVLALERGWKVTRLARQFQCEAYRLALPQPSVVTLAPPSPVSKDARNIEAHVMLGRVAAGGRS